MSRGRRRCWGKTINENGMKEGLEVLHMLATSPATAHFISTKLAVRFVSDDPPPALVDRMAASVPEERRRHQDGAADDVRVAGVLGADGGTGEGEDAGGVCDLGGAGERGAGERTPQALVQALDKLGMPLYGMQTPNGYSLDERAVGEHGGAGEPDELRAGAGGRPAAGGADGLDAGCWASEPRVGR